MGGSPYPPLNPKPGRIPCKIDLPRPITELGLMAALHFVPLLRQALQYETLSSGNCALSMLVAPKRRPSFLLTRAAVTTLPTGCGRVTLKFEELKKRGKVALIPYIAAGYPDLETTAEALRLLSTMGADIIELGVPYSDPLADGPVIQEAYTKALANGVTLDCVLDMLRKVQPTLSAPIVLFTYFNPILRRGLERFFEDIRAAGVSGLIVPDVPLEETAKLREVSTTKNIDLILLATPTSPLQRMEEIAKSSQGFVYLVSITGVTGARTSMDSRVKRLISDLKMVTDKPISVGFGVSKPEHVAQVVDWGADGVIIGSSVVKLLGQSGSPAEGLAALKSYITGIKAALP